ncbi:MAG TPA: methyltransferase domain-containing protein [Haliangiales bacterium]|nr:methyltransferase domain-containing protein [Haliangiales bacterium]
MLADPHRMDAYERAIRRLVRPGDVVLDLGAGTGVLAMLAARAGAARVHAVESMPIARLAGALVRENGLADRVIVHEADATRLAPVEPVDLVVSDFLGCFLVDDDMIPATAAAGRWLKPAGRFSPSAVRLWLAPVGDLRFAPIDDLADRFYGLSFGAAHRRALAGSYRADLRPEQLLAPAARFAEYLPPAAEPPAGAEMRFALRSGRLRGLGGWFDADLASGVGMSNAPGTDTHWAQQFFPLPETAVWAGDVLTVRLDVRAPEWTLAGELARGGAVAARYAWSSAGEAAAIEPSPPPHDDRPSVAELNAAGAAAYAAARFVEAAAAWEEAVRLAGPRAPAELFENLGLGLLASGRPLPAMRALLRALDGAPASARQALEFLVRACAAAGRAGDAAYYRALYEATFGPYP